MYIDILSFFNKYLFSKGFPTWFYGAYQWIHMNKIPLCTGVGRDVIHAWFSFYLYLFTKNICIRYIYTTIHVFMCYIKYIYLQLLYNLEQLIFIIQIFRRFKIFFSIPTTQLDAQVTSERPTRLCCTGVPRQSFWGQDFAATFNFRSLS